MKEQLPDGAYVYDWRETPNWARDDSPRLYGYTGMGMVLDCGCFEGLCRHVHQPVHQPAPRRRLFGRKP